MNLHDDAGDASWAGIVAGDGTVLVIGGHDDA
jgi:hypothetical protein